MEYLVRWEIEVTADDPKDAVREAIACMPKSISDSNTLATVFDVFDQRGARTLTSRSHVRVDISDDMTWRGDK